VPTSVLQLKMKSTNQTLTVTKMPSLIKGRGIPCYLLLDVIAPVAPDDNLVTVG